MESPKRNFTTPNDDYIAGGCMLALTLLGVVGYVPCLFVIVRTKDMIKDSFYKIMVSLGISDCLALFCWLIISVHTLTHAQFYVLAVATKHANSVLSITWTCLSAHLLVIAFNRFCAVFRFSWHYALFKKGIRVYFWLAAAWIIGVAGPAPAVIPARANFRIDGYGWRFPTRMAQVKYWRYFIPFDLAVTSTVFIGTGLSYLLVIIRLQIMKSNESGADANTQRRNDGKQAKLVIQTIIITVIYYSYAVLFWFVFTYLEVDYMKTLWVRFALYYALWIFNNAMNPWIYFAFNKTLRNETRKLFCKH